LIATYQRRPDGLVERLTHGNGVVTTKTYDTVGRIVTIEHIAPDGTVLDGETSRYDAMNRRTALQFGCNQGCDDMFPVIDLYSTTFLRD
jgi:hypothetical protein